jgi:hypothetical protein
MRNSVPETSRSAIIISMPSEPEKAIVVTVAAEPPKVYIPACGVLCDVFWWARRDPSPEESAPKAREKVKKDETS